MLQACFLLAVAAEPQCPTDVPSCVRSYIPDVSYDYSGGNNDQMCNTTTWMVDEYCESRCPMRLVISEPPELRTWMCVTDNVFAPYAPDAHIDLYHPLNNKELDIEIVGDPTVGSTRHGCAAADYAVGNKSFAGKIVLVGRGSCYFITKAHQAQTAGAAMLFAVDSNPLTQHGYIAGSSEGIESFPMAYVSRHEADYIVSALDKGVKVKGRFQYRCDDMPAGLLDNPQGHPWDKCPTSRIM